MNKITCKKEHDHKNGCDFCGGYKYVFIKYRCSLCHRIGWFSPGPISVYEGKRYYSIDGLEMVYHMDKWFNCIYCENKKEKR